MTTAPQPLRPPRSAQRISSGKDILSRMLQMEKQSKVRKKPLQFCIKRLVCRGTDLINPCLLTSLMANVLSVFLATTILIRQCHHPASPKNNVCPWAPESSIALTQDEFKLPSGHASIIATPFSHASLANRTFIID